MLLQHFEETLTAEDRETLTIVSPDMGRVRVADTWSDSLGAPPLAIIHKRRDPKVANQSPCTRSSAPSTGAPASSSTT